LKLNLKLKLNLTENPKLLPKILPKTLLALFMFNPLQSRSLNLETREWWRCLMCWRVECNSVLAGTQTKVADDDGGAWLLRC